MQTSGDFVSSAGRQGAADALSSRWRVLAVGAVAALALAAALLGGAPATAVVPGDNGQIVFETNRDGNPEIYVMNADGTIERNLTDDPDDDPRWDFYPVWSPDSTQILWGSDRGERFNVDVWKMDADGTNMQRLTDEPGEDRGASFSSDGSKIVYHSETEAGAHTFDLMVMDADGGNKMLLDENGSAGYVCATPGVANTDKVVFNSNRTGAFEIYTINIDGTGLTQVTDFGDFNSGPKWSPDCESIVFNRFDEGGSLDVFRMDIDDPGTLTNLTNQPGDFEAFAAWSPDGERIVFTSNRDVDGNFEVYTMDATDGGNVEQYTHTKRGQANFRSDWGTAPAYTGPPTDKDQCKRGEWQVFTTPSFDNQGKCVAFVEAADPQ